MHALYRRYSKDVYRYVFWLSGSAADADDLTAETFVRAWTSRKPIRTATAKAYLLKIARNLFLATRRRQRRTAELSDDLPDPRPGPEQLALDSHALDEVRALLAELSEIDRSALLLRSEHGLPYREIARVLGISVSAAKVKVHRARLRLTTLRLTTSRLTTSRTARQQPQGDSDAFDPS